MSIHTQILLQSVNQGLTKSLISTREVVRLLDDKRYNKNSLILDKYAIKLGRVNVSKGEKPHYKFSFIKVVALKIELMESKQTDLKIAS